MVLDRLLWSTSRLETSRWKMKDSSIGRQVELARQNIQLREIKEIGRDLVVQEFKGKNSNFVLNMAASQGIRGQNQKNDS